jgi:corrinoid protein of di/trimethylamine methyltransferase
MSKDHNLLLEELSNAVLDMDEKLTVSLSQEAVAQGIDAYIAIDRGLSDGMSRAGKLFEEGEYFIPELLMCSDAMYAGLGILTPHLKIDNSVKKHKIVIGVIEGDTHDIGKNLVKIMLEASGFDMIDLGRDVPPRLFVDRAKDEGASVIALSTLMTTTMDGMAEVIRILDREQIRDRFKIMIGGGPISQGFADTIRADGYSSDAASAVRLAKNLTAEITA